MNTRGVLSLVVVLWSVPTAVHGQVDASASFQSYQAHLAAAEKSLRLQEATELKRWLQQAPEQHRGWEWSYLDAVADTSQRTVVTPDVPIRISMSADGTQIATVEGNAVRLWKFPELEPLGTIAEHTDAIYRAVFDAEGRRLVTVARDVTSRVWDVGTGQEVSHIDLVNPAFAAATFSPDGSRAATCAWQRDAEGKVQGVVWIWKPEDGQILKRQTVGVKPLSAIRYTPDGQRLVVGSWGGLVHVLDADAQEISRIELPSEDVYNAVNDLAISPDGSTVAAAVKDRTVRVFTLASGELTATLRGHLDYVEGVAFSPDGKTLATSSGDATVRLWNTVDWKPTAVLRGSLDTVRGVVWTADGNTLVSCSLDNRLRVWDLTRRHAEQLTIEAGLDGTYSAAFSPDGKHIAVACFDGTLRVFDSASGAKITAWDAHPGSTCNSAAYTANGSRLLTCSWDKTARLWDPGTSQQVATFDAEQGVYSCAISDDGSHVALSAGGVQIWDVASGKRLHQLNVEGAIATRLAFSHIGARLASAWSDGVVRVYDTATGELAVSLSGDDTRVESVSFTSDDQQVVTGDNKGVVRLFPAAGGEPLFAVDTGSRGVEHVAVSGNRIAAATDLLWIIDLQHGGAVLDRRAHADAIYHLSWSPDGHRIATCCQNGTIAVLGPPQF